ncbi:hypothetical protein [Streptomyces sp. NPDC101206]|uniref:hypothetical protein n=1 Tax=Streptomyces sp. NPDC101206 TaxID=3366128 RepID=UPI003817E8DC
MSGTPADRSAFLATGLRIAQAEDDRVAVGKITARPQGRERHPGGTAVLRDGRPVPGLMPDDVGHPSD